MSSEPPELPRTRSRLPFEPLGSGGNRRTALAWLYATATIVLAGVAVYMGAIERHALISGYVLAPAIGALWFGLRTFILANARSGS